MVSARGSLGVTSPVSDQSLGRQSQGYPGPVRAKQRILKPVGRGGGRHVRGNLEGKELGGGKALR